MCRRKENSIARRLPIWFHIMHDLNGLAGHAVINVQTATQMASSVKKQAFLSNKTSGHDG